MGLVLPVVALVGNNKEITSLLEFPNGRKVVVMTDKKGFKSLRSLTKEKSKAGIISGVDDK